MLTRIYHFKFSFAHEKTAWQNIYLIMTHIEIPVRSIGVGRLRICCWVEFIMNWICCQIRIGNNWNCPNQESPTPLLMKSHSLDNFKTQDFQKLVLWYFKNYQKHNGPRVLSLDFIQILEYPIPARPSVTKTVKCGYLGNPEWYHRSAGVKILNIKKKIKHRKNCECCPVSQLIVR